MSINAFLLLFSGQGMCAETAVNVQVSSGRQVAAFICLCALLVCYSLLPVLSLLPGINAQGLSGFGNVFYFFEVCLLLTVRDTRTLRRAQIFVVLLGVVQIGQGLSAYHLSTTLSAEAILGLGSTFRWYHWIDSILLPTLLMLVICVLPISAFPWIAAQVPLPRRQKELHRSVSCAGSRRPRRSTSW